MPRAHEVIHSNSGMVPVVVTDVPRGAHLQPIVDGVPKASQTRAGFTLHGISRGNHRLVVRVLDAHGRVLDRTPSVVFHVWHASRQ